MSEKLKDIDVVLVNSQDSKNVGAVCRVMKTMGLSSLSLVGLMDIDFLKAKVLAVHARDILEGARYFDSLEDALGDESFIAGITRRRGKKRKYLSFSPEELAEKICLIEKGRVALVFGNEATGLTDEQLAYCHIAVSIPSSALFPSLNLSHAVQVITYQIFRKLNSTYNAAYSPVSNKKLLKTVSTIVRSLENIGFFKQVSSDDMAIFFKDILARAFLSRREAERIEAIFKKIHGLMRR